MGLPSVFVTIVSVLLLAVLLRRAFGGRYHEPRHPEQPAATAESELEIKQLVHDLGRTADNLEKRLESLETILLDRTRMPL